MALMKAFASSFLAFLILDYVWLGFVMKPFNTKELAEIGRFKDGNFDVLYGPALIVYLFMSLMVVAFILPRLEATDSLAKIFLTGALAGLLVYGIFDMTNLAILNKYPLKFALVDMAWGTFLFGVVTTLVKKVA